MRKEGEVEPKQLVHRSDGPLRPISDSNHHGRTTRMGGCQQSSRQDRGEMALGLTSVRQIRQGIEFRLERRERDTGVRRGEPPLMTNLSTARWVTTPIRLWS